MKLIKTTEAVGHVLCHDITQIIRDVKKGPAFRKGHIVKEADIPVLLSLGKDHLYVWKKQEGMLRAGASDEALKEAVADTIINKPLGHNFCDKDRCASENRKMVQIGG